MWASLTYKLKNRVLLAGTLMFLLIMYLAAIQKTVEAVKLNNDLKEKAENGNALIYNPSYLNHKKQALDHLVSVYKVSKDNWYDSFWTTVSNQAYEKGVQVIYSPVAVKETAAADSVAGLLRQNIQFSGDFRGLVKLTQLLEQTPNNGRINSLKMVLKGREPEHKKVLMDLSVVGIQK
ncbi:MAG: hypothetical protein JWQ25_1020 [Daejeonella sp.]|nr:hypothetical protein [Daejeonella sp.]